MTTFFDSCRKDLESKIQPKTVVKPANTKELVAPSGFHWATVSHATIEFNPAKSGLLLILNEKAEVIHKAFLISGKLHSARVSVPYTSGRIHIYMNGSHEEIIIGSSTYYSSKLK